LNYKYFVILFFAYIAGVNAGDLNITPSVETSLVESSTDFNQTEDRQTTTITVEPELSMDYSSSRFKGQLNASIQHLQQDIDSQSSNSNYTNYGYSGELSLIENLLKLGIQGKQSYRNAQSTGYLSSDALLNADQLSKTTKNSISLDFSLPKPRYIGLDLSGTISQVDSNKQTNSTESLDNRNTQAQARVYQGSELTHVSWNIAGTYSNDDRSSNNSGSINNDLKSTRVNAEILVGLVDKLRLVVSANSEENSRSNSNTFSGRNLSADSYGAGLAWYESSARNISLTYNQFSQPNVADENFVGLDLNWQFTNRTSVRASYGQRFFGKSGEFSFSHNTKHLRSRVAYNERLTTFSRLVIETQDAGLFVCPLGIESISDCFQPTSLNYELQQGEQFLNFSIDVPDISNEIILRKSLNASIGFDRRKVSMALTLAHTKTDYVETDREQTSNIVGISSTYKAGPKTSFNLGLNYSEIERATTEPKDKTYTGTLGMSRSLSNNLSTTASLRYLDRNSTASTSTNITDRRLTLSLQYRF
jgi:uncharacterized protein (PEP-CTERM system associated)